MTRFTTSLFALTLIACDPTSGTPQPEPAFGCQETSREVITDLTAPRGDFIPADVLDAALGDFDGDLSREDVPFDNLSIQLVQTGDAEWVEYGFDDNGSPQPAIGCPSAMHVPVNLTVEGAELAEILPGMLSVGSANDIRIFGRVDGFDLNGTAAPLTLDTSALDVLELQVNANLQGDSWTGDVAFGGEATDGETVSWTLDPWADFVASR